MSMKGEKFLVAGDREGECRFMGHETNKRS